MTKKTPYRHLYTKRNLSEYKIRNWEKRETKCKQTNENTSSGKRENAKGYWAHTFCYYKYNDTIKVCDLRIYKSIIFILNKYYNI